jgi:hypothetical protein
MTTNSEDTTITTTTTPRPATLANRGVVQLSTLDDVARLAKIAADSGLAKVRTPAECAVILMTGAELGLSPMQSLRGIYVVEGRPTLAADTMVAVIRRSGVCALWRTVESTAERCTIEAKRNDDERTQSKTWTMADATRAGLAQKSIWKQYPAQMLRHRCASDLARELFSDVVLGLYDPEELDGTTYDATTAQEPPQRSANPMEGRGIEDQRRRPQTAAETPAPADIAQPVAAPPKPSDITDAQAEFLDGFYKRVAKIELPGEGVAVWLKHRVNVSTLPARERENSWKAIVSRCEEVGKMRNAKLWLKKAIAEEDERRNEESGQKPTTKRAKTLDTLTDAPAAPVATEVTP